MLRLDQDLSTFYDQARDDPDLAWAVTGAGRMIQSPTVFEDVIKTVCTTNCTWSATVRMVNALVSELGDPATGGSGPLTNAFPTPDVMASAPEAFYRDVVRAGYRGAYLIELSRRVASGEVDLEALAAAGPDERTDDELEQQLLALPGVGPYAAAHIMMTIGHNSRLILDSWTRPTYAKALGRTKPVVRRRDPATVPPLRRAAGWRSGCSSPATGSTSTQGDRLRTRYLRQAPAWALRPKGFPAKGCPGSVSGGILPRATWPTP